MLTVSNITVDFGKRLLFQQITFAVKPTDKIGLAGRNGAGKSTLLKIIAGVQHPTSGTISSAKDYTIGYLPQELKITSNETVFEEAKSAFKQLEQLVEKQEQITHQIMTRTDYESDEYMSLIEDLNHYNDLLEYHGGSDVDKRVEEVLKGLGFQHSDMQKPIREFSGGWQMRVELAKLLLKQPDLILLDEPTNHLDIESIIWLEEFLIQHKGALIMVSHDRNFLDAITNRTIEIINQGIEDYKAPYSQFLEQRVERVQKLEQAKKNQEREIAQMERNVEKFRAKKNKAKFAQTLIRKLDKMDRIEIDNYDSKNMVFQFHSSRRSGKEVVVAEKVSKSYGEKQVIKELSFKLFRGEQIAFVGKNGMGKSTLAKMIVNEITDYVGKLTLGVNVDIGYYAQHQNTTLDESITVLETIEKHAPKEMQGKERSLLGAFLFSGTEVDKKVKVLSGGEKARLVLAKMMLCPINFLVLDEPTNHLDLQSKDVLKQAVKNFEGSLIVVSHDRDFLTGLTDKVYEFTENGIQEHLGDIQEFLRVRGARNFREFEQDIVDPVKEKESTSVHSEQDYKKRKEVQKLLKTKENRLKKVEKLIQEKETLIADINNQLKDPKFYENRAKDSSFFLEYENKKQEINLLYEEYDRLLTEITDLQLNLGFN